MHAVELLDDYVDVIKRVFDLVVSVCRWKFQLQDESIQLVEYDDERHAFAHYLRDQLLYIECHPLDTVDQNYRAIAQPEGRGHLV